MAREQSVMPSNLQAGAEELVRTVEAEARNAMAMRQEVFGLLEEAQRDWLKLAEREAHLMSEFSTALSACKSLPDVAKAYQDWMSEQLEMSSQASQRMFANGQRLMVSAVTMIGTSGLRQ